MTPLRLLRILYFVGIAVAGYYCDGVAKWAKMSLVVTFALLYASITGLYLWLAMKVGP